MLIKFDKFIKIAKVVDIFKSKIENDKFKI